MKKKVLFGLGAFAVAVVLTLNVTLAKKRQNGEILLNTLVTVAQAQTEACGCIACDEKQNSACYLDCKWWYGWNCLS